MNTINRVTGNGWRMIYQDGKIISMFESCGITESPHPIFFAPTKAECESKANDLNLSWYNPVKRNVIRKRKLRALVQSWGKESLYDQFINALPEAAKKEFMDSENLWSDNPMFVEYAQQFKTFMGITDVQFEEIFTA